MVKKYLKSKINNFFKTKQKPTKLKQMKKFAKLSSLKMKRNKKRSEGALRKKKISR